MRIVPPWWYASIVLRISYFVSIAVGFLLNQVSTRIMLSGLRFFITRFIINILHLDNSANPFYSFNVVRSVLWFCRIYFYIRKNKSICFLCFFSNIYRKLSVFLFTRSYLTLFFFTFYSLIFFISWCILIAFIMFFLPVIMNCLFFKRTLCKLLLLPTLLHVFLDPSSVIFIQFISGYNWDSYLFVYTVLQHCDTIFMLPFVVNKLFWNSFMIYL